jgi:serine kinase of HPr protein (carbohydrate metabolism regulator)
VEPDPRIEIRGIGVFSAASIFPAHVKQRTGIRLVVALSKFDPQRDAGRVTPLTGFFPILDHQVPLIHAPLVSGCDPALVVEVLAGMYRNDTEKILV